jgi:ABC-type multidrug transport system fused ATPase/permease subunit
LNQSVYMNTTDSILQRSVTAPFYRRNAGLFLFIFFLLFGLQPNFKQTLEFHYDIINGISTSVNFFFISLLIWFLYACKTIHFFNGCAKNKAYHFLQNLNAISPGKRFLHLLILQLQLLSPVLCYGMAVVIVAVINHHIAGGIAVLFTLAGLCIFTTVAANFLLQKTKSSAFKKILPSFPSLFSANLFSFLLKFIFNEQFIVLLLLKLVTFSCLYFFAKTDAQVFEDRLLWLIYLTSLAGHSILIYRNHHFMETKMSFYRNLPVRPMATLLSLLGVYVIVLIPEIWALKGVAIEQHAIINYIWMILTGPSLLLMLHCLLYTEDMKMEGFLQLLFGVWIVTLFFSLSSIRWLLPLICLGMAVIIFFTSYCRYEKNTAVEALE